MDALTHHRRGMGLPSLTINWGPWAEGGMATRLGSQHQNRMMTQGTSPISPEGGLQVLADLLAQDSTQVGVLPINWSQFFKQLPVGTKIPFLENFTSTVRLSKTEKSNFMQRLEVTPVEERRELLVTHVREQVARVLGLTVPEQIGLRQSLFDLGIDSLMAVELRNHLQSSLGHSIRSTALFDYPSLEELVNFLQSDVLSIEFFVPKDSSSEAINSQDSIIKSVKQFKNDWIAYHRPNPTARLRLFCFHYLGGSASVFREWSDTLLPSDIEICPVQLPGREERFREQPFTEFIPLIETLGQALSSYLDKPFAFYGHSLGTFICFELAHLLRQQYGLSPMHLFVGGLQAPHAHFSKFKTRYSSSEQILNYLLNISEIPQSILDDQSLFEKFTLLFKADAQLLSKYIYSKKELLVCPISAFGGTDDPVVSREELSQWYLHTSGTFKLQMLPGKHMFLKSSQKLLVEAISQELMTHLSHISRST
jgi:surfactin synthase thioesterase subunit/acyl carrier protein